MFKVDIIIMSTLSQDASRSRAVDAEVILQLACRVEASVEAAATSMMVRRTDVRRHLSLPIDASPLKYIVWGMTPTQPS